MNRHKTFYDDGFFSKARHGKFIMKNLMFKKQFGLLLTIVCIVMNYGCQPPSPLQYQYTEIYLEGWEGVSIVGINNKGEVIGNAHAHGLGLAFMYSNGQFTQFPAPQGLDAKIDVIGINNNSQVIGNNQWWEDSVYLSKAFLFSDGNWIEILPQWTMTFARDINDKGEVLGYGKDQNGVLKNFIYKNGKHKEIRPSLVKGEFHYNCISNNGCVAGSVRMDEEKERVFVYHNGIYRILPKPLGYRDRFTNVFVKDINDKGDLLVRLTSSWPKGPDSSFIYRYGIYTKIKPPGSEYYCCPAVAINKKGDAVLQGSAAPIIYHCGRYRELTPLEGWDYITPKDMNDNGEIAGILSNENDRLQKGFVAVPVD
jgi:hypothetical protein